VLGHNAECPHLRSGPDLDPDADHGPHADRDIPAQAHSARLDDAVLHRVTGEVNRVADDDVVAELEQVVVHDREAVHVDPAPHVGAVQSVERRPHRCRAE
jgi:hypothetical protein